ncbi:MAG: BamA/TamA family outer membrane protein [Bacteroidales bacterium]
MTIKFSVKANCRLICTKGSRFFVMGLLFFTSCSITRNVPEDKYLLNKSRVKVGSWEVNQSELDSYLKQHPNKKIMGFRFHLRLYNLASSYKSKGMSQWLRKIGEEPVILDTTLVNEGTQNVLLYLQSKGFYKAAISDTIRYHGKKADVYYTVTPDAPYRIRSISYFIEDTVIQRLVKADSANCLITRNQLFDRDLLQSERTRLESYLRNSGYYSFSKNFVTFTADTNIGKHNVDLVLQIRNPMLADDQGNRVQSNFKRYKIKRVFIYPSYDPIVFISKKMEVLLDTVTLNDIEFIFPGDPGVNLNVLSVANSIRPGILYSNDVVQKTQNSFNLLKLYKFVNVNFTENNDAAEPPKFDLFAEPVDNVDSLLYGYLDCHIQLSQNTLQSYQIELVGTNTTGSMGAEGNFIYQHKNLFRGAEVFDFKLRGLIESTQKQIQFNNAVEVGGSLGLSLPKYLGPFASRNFITRKGIRTQVTASYSFQRRPDYTRTIVSLMFGYSWKGTGHITHNFNPIEINAIRIPRISNEFESQIENTTLKYSYINQIVTVSSYSLIFNNQNLQKLGSYTYFRYNLESSGNILSLAYSSFNRPKSPDGTYRLLNTSFSQFIRSDINFTYHHVIDKINTFAYRVFIGVGYPYGNSKALPFEKRYFSGGANGIRAWQARALGPGSYYQGGETYPNRTSDIKLEANAEYRFKLFWKMEGAMFLDAGNIWSMPGLDTRPGTIFKFGKFYEQIALGGGVGLRVNLGFFTFRTDFGYKIFDPSINPNEKFKPWTFQHKFKWSDINFNFGIGYPF